MSLKAINAYKKGTLKQDIINADPHKLTLMLMQGALDRLAIAKGCIERNDLQGRAEHISKATAIFINLRDTLNLELEGDFSENLYALYNYFLEKLSDLLDCLNESPIDETQLSHLVEQRAKLVDILLNSLNSQQRQEFALSETKINQDLIARVSKVHASAKKALSDVASSSRAIKQYQQV